MAKAKTKLCNEELLVLENLVDPEQSIVKVCVRELHDDGVHQDQDGFIWSEAADEAELAFLSAPQTP